MITLICAGGAAGFMAGCLFAGLVLMESRPHRRWVVLLRLPASLHRKISRRANVYGRTTAEEIVAQLERSMEEKERPTLMEIKRG